jgi:lipoprotein-anchoring transpeptidase ErfK/SrfK
LFCRASIQPVRQYPVNMMKKTSCRRAASCGAALALTLAAWPAAAGVIARIDQGQQRMRVFVDGRAAYDWPVSTARSGFVTPNGRYRVGRMATMWRSHKYHGAPMPHAMFFRGGYAIHGTYATGALGRRASHGCVRLSPGNAARLFHLARAYGGAAVELRN